MASNNSQGGRPIQDIEAHMPAIQYLALTASSGTTSLKGRLLDISGRVIDFGTDNLVSLTITTTASSFAALFYTAYTAEIPENAVGFIGTNSSGASIYYNYGAAYDWTAAAGSRASMPSDMTPKSGDITIAASQDPVVFGRVRIN